MKIKTLSLLAGVSAPLILTTPSHAGLVGLTTTAKPNAFNLYVVNVYAEFDNPGGDWFHKMFGSQNSPMNINVVGGVFYNNQFGSDQAPGTALIGVFPSLAYDSFYTIGIKALAAGSVNALTFINMPTLIGSSITTGPLGGTAALVPSTAAQGNPFDPINSFPGDGRILIGQYSVQIPDTGPYGIAGEFLVYYTSDGTGGVSWVNFSSVVPGPHVVGCLGLAGLIGARRRRRPEARRE